MTASFPQPGKPIEQMREAEYDRRLAWISQVRGLHRNKRMIGFAGIIAGSGMLLWWKLTPSAPDWAMWAGGGVLGVSWLLFVYVIFDRWRYVKNNPYKPS
ncbi:MAG: hypothetical protein ABL956_10345 [Hyphomonadaceae bacterium]